jgi:hypothetical protein
MISAGPTTEPPPRQWLPGWALAAALALWPQPALASEVGGPQWLGAGISLGLFLLIVLAAAWILRKPSPTDTESGAEGFVAVAPPAPPAPPPQFGDTRLGRLQQGITRRREELKGGAKGFAGDTSVMSAFIEGCKRMERGEGPPVAPERQLPPGTLPRLTRLYEQLLSATPARARDWPLQRANLSSQIRTAFGQSDTNRLLELLDALAKRRIDRQQPSADEAASWSEFLSHFRDTPTEAAPLAVTPAGELAIAEDVPTSTALALAAPHANDDDAPTVDTDLLFPPQAPSLTSEEDVPTVGASRLAPAEPPSVAEDAPTVDTDNLFPPREVLAEDAPTVDTDNLFPTPRPLEGEAPTLDTESLLSEPAASEEDAPTVDTENLFSKRKVGWASDDDDDEDDAPTVDTFRLFDDPAPTGKRPSSGRRKRRGARPPLASFTETDELLDPVEDAPTRDTADLFGSE